MNIQQSKLSKERQQFEDTDMKFDNSNNNSNNNNNINSQDTECIRILGNTGLLYILLYYTSKKDEMKLSIPYFGFECLVDIVGEWALLPWHKVLKFGRWFYRYNVVTLPCYNYMCLGGKENINITTTWPSEIIHKFTKIFDIPWIPRVDIFIGLSKDIAKECDRLLLYEIQHRSMKDRQMGESKWGAKSRMVGTSLKSDKHLQHRFAKLKAHVVANKLKDVSWNRVCSEANAMNCIGGKIYAMDGTNFKRYCAFRSAEVRGRFNLWLTTAEKQLGVDVHSPKQGEIDFANIPKFNVDTNNLNGQFNIGILKGKGKEETE